MQRKAVLRMTGPTTGVVEYVDVPVEISTPPLDLSKIPPEWTARIEVDRELTNELVPEQRELQTVPIHWTKGQLLNVRNNGAEWVVTVLGEEFDPRYPDRALKFPHSVACQAFISKWYQREHHDPRAF